jgi:hypothetical protein
MFLIQHVVLVYFIVKVKKNNSVPRQTKHFQFYTIIAQLKWLNLVMVNQFIDLKAN